ncbi:MAG: glycerol-3-phosphate dehydrogenase [Alphaproteobacteria bacterium 64-11]|nr:NAD(P)-dependent glycerol-3-phosphate dehydrogenase [Alphaproteobacteria bacterium]OJU14061.1 MAG: glycerol-3-phosphate dehydrogenase [Alphaproteobacteria bacterium 64-11]
MSDPIFPHIAVLGAGAWGTALALAANAAGRRTTLWVREPDVLEALKAGRENRFLPGIALPPDLGLTGDLAEAARADALLLVVPAQVLGIFAATLKPHLRPGTPLVICAKGIEKESGRLVTEIVADALPGFPLALLSGPSFARDVARGLPTAVTIAAKGDLAARLQASLGSATFRPYASDDPIGVALGGAAKNVYAIACGVVEGMGLGENARAALLARSFAELARLGEALGARRETLMGLSGLGDLVLTATSPSSRNFSFGMELGRGAGLAELTQPGRPLAEGVATAPALVARAKKEGVELPIAEAVADLLGGVPAGEAVMRLMGRPLKPE